MTRKKVEEKKRSIPVWFLWTVIGLLIYASISNYLVFTELSNINRMIVLSKIAIIITLVWFLLNTILAVYFKTKGYETKAWAFCTYYAIINALNIWKIFSGTPISSKFLFGFQIVTKIFELCIVIPALVKHYRKK